MVSVLIVDDHPVFRASARRLLERDGFEIVGEAADGASAVALTHELDPDIVLLDVALPDTSGFEVADTLREGRAAVVLVSSREQADLAPQLRRAAARGFIAKDELTTEALRALVERES